MGIERGASLGWTEEAKVTGLREIIERKGTLSQPQQMQHSLSATSNIALGSQSWPCQLEHLLPGLVFQHIFLSTSVMN